MSDYRYIRITYLYTWVRVFSIVYVLQAYLEQDGNISGMSGSTYAPDALPGGIQEGKRSNLSETQLNSMLTLALKQSARHYPSVRSGPGGIASSPSPPSLAVPSPTCG
jgi:hypothetical protein